jgi:signal transduction histidine kinase
MDDWKADIRLVDDEPKNLLALEAIMEPLRQNLLLARSGEEAIRLALDRNPAVMLLDVRMPGLDGFETAQTIRMREQSRHTPIIFMTAAIEDMHTVFRGYELGAVDFLVKPLLPEALRSKVAVFVELHRKTAALANEIEEGRIRNAALANEIQERKVAEAQLRESEVKLRALAARLISIREEERTRIAREIHDELGQRLTELKMDVSWLGKQLEGNQKPLLEKIESARRLIDSTVHFVRRISTGMRPEVLDDMGLVAAIGWQAREFQKRMGIRCRLALPPDNTVVDREVSTAVFRIFQEILTNIARHARANSVNVRLKISGSRLSLEVMDDGIGISEAQTRGHRSFGLLGMKERAQIFGGEVHVYGTSRRGTTVFVSIPLQQAGVEERRSAPPGTDVPSGQLLL